MPKFSYKAKNDKGRFVSGQIESSSKSEAKNNLYNKGLKPFKIVRIANTDSDSPPKGISKYIYKDSEGRIQIRLSEELPTTKEMALFTKQFSLMVENGINVISAIKLLHKGQKKAGGKILHLRPWH